MLDRARMRIYRLIVYLAVAAMVAGTATTPPWARAVTCVIYLGLGLVGVALHLVLSRAPRRGFWILAMALDVGAHAFVLARMGAEASPFLLLLALPVLVWGLMQGVSGGMWAAGGAVLVDLLVLASWAGPGGPQNFADVFTGRLWILPFQALAFLLLGLFSGLLGRRIQQEERLRSQMQRELEQAQLDAELIVSRLSSGLLCLDGAGRITRLNTRAQDLLGAEVEVGAELQRLAFHPGLARLTTLLAERLEAQEETTREIGVGESDRERVLDVTITPVVSRDGQTRGLVVLLSDQTERRALQAEREQRKKLALIGELSAGLAHEIRNSLKPITGSVELLRAEGRTPGSHQETLMEIILREAENLENFLTEFLTFARDKKLQLETLPLERVVGEELESLNARDHSPFRLVRPTGVDSAIAVRADRSALRQILRNLGVNALEAGGERIDVGWRREGREGVVFIRDHGPGIPESIRDRVFDPFFTTKPGGTGLGLAIARDLVDRQNGRLTLQPAEGGGTLACVRLSLAQAEGGRSIEAPGPDSAARAA